MKLQQLEGVRAVLSEMAGAEKRGAVRRDLIGALAALSEVVLRLSRVPDAPKVSPLSKPTPKTKPKAKAKKAPTAKKAAPTVTTKKARK
ncbi:MAG TPA: hypothetical protein VMZ50_06670 [Phycisphaerae bacterium]|nr:hypothetical protein [Phycisphaerae bacterium]